MNDYTELFIERYGTSLISDAAYRAGVQLGILSAGLGTLDPASKLAGPVLTVEANNDLVSILEAVHVAEPGHVIVIANRTDDVALIGDLIGTEAIRKGLGGFVVDGRVRDVIELNRLGVTVICRGSYPIGPLKLPSVERGIGEVGVPVYVAGVQARTGSWIFGDADGVVLLDEDDLPQVFDGAHQADVREADLAEEIRSGTPLGIAFELDGFLAEREADPAADFNQHLAKIGRAI